MKEYRLASWPELPGNFRRAGHRRILSDMSHRYLTVAQLVDRSNLKRQDVDKFIDLLDVGGHLSVRNAVIEPLHVRAAQLAGEWLRRALAALQR
ncbi:MAG: hypothetical protein ABIV63_18690 [Caldimonas sp.]